MDHPPFEPPRAPAWPAHDAPAAGGSCAPSAPRATGLAPRSDARDLFTAMTELADAWEARGLRPDEAPAFGLTLRRLHALHDVAWYGRHLLLRARDGHDRSVARAPRPGQTE